MPQWARGDGEGQGRLVCCGPWGHKESDTTERAKTTMACESRIPPSSGGKLDTEHEHQWYRYRNVSTLPLWQ